ncbi:MAG: nitroreductase family deazaflavin-dependent oxidoreductase [Hamadaea sp.]|nr:nitroreductase family deazaflavin-dependent oxidoreductase [Hamadaea sp.]
MSLLSIAQRLGRYRWFAAFGRTVFVPADRLIAKATKGRVIALGVLPSLTITTIGRKSGQPRTQPLVYVPDGDDFAVIGSNWGQTHHPAWSANLLAHPQAEVVVKGQRVRVRAELATGEERRRLWEILLRTWPAYQIYAERSGRDLRIFKLVREAD